MLIVAKASSAHPGHFDILSWLLHFGSFWDLFWQRVSVGLSKLYPLCLWPSLEKVGVPHPVFSNLFGKVRMNSIEEGNSHVPWCVAFSMNYLGKLITLTRSSIVEVHDCGTPTWPTLCCEGPTCQTRKFTANQVTTDEMSIVFTFHHSMLAYGHQQTRHITSLGDTRRRSPLYAEALGSAPASPSEVYLARSEPKGQVRPSKRGIQIPELHRTMIQKIGIARHSWVRWRIAN